MKITELVRAFNQAYRVSVLTPGTRADGDAPRVGIRDGQNQGGGEDEVPAPLWPGVFTCEDIDRTTKDEQSRQSNNSLQS